MMITPAQPALTLAALPVEVWVYGGIAALTAAAIAVCMACYKRCPSNRILVVYGKVGQGRSSKCLHGGGVFVVPLIQDYSYLSLEPLKIETGRIRLRDAERVWMETEATFTFAISTDPVLMNNAAERLLNMPTELIREQVLDIVLGQIKLTVGSLTAVEIEDDPERYMGVLVENVAHVLDGLGLYVLNVNVPFIERQPT